MGTFYTSRGFTKLKINGSGFYMKIFEAIKVTKKIDGKTLVKEVSVSISQGEKVVITGKNGSGKSSLLKLIGGIYTETEGLVKRAQIKIGYVPEQFPEDIRFRVQNYLMLVGKMSFITVEEIISRIEKYAEIFAIKEFLNVPIKKCSKGTKQKIGLIQALLTNPDLLLLDEPLTGLDEMAKIELFNQLKSLPKDITIIFTAHDPLLIEGLADRVLTVERGKIISDSPKMNRVSVRMIRAKIANRDLIEEIPSIKHQFVGGDTVEIIVSANESDQTLGKLIEHGCSIFELIEKR